MSLDTVLGIVFLAMSAVCYAIYRYSSEHVYMRYQKDGKGGTHAKKCPYCGASLDSRTVRTKNAAPVVRTREAAKAKYDGAIIAPKRRKCND